MKKLQTLIGMLIPVMSVVAQLTPAAAFPVYTGSDLGVVYNSNRSAFRIWSPSSDAAVLSFYQDGIDDEAFLEVNMDRSIDGTWTALVNGDLAGRFYTFRVKSNGRWSMNVPDPYAKAVGSNGKRAQVLALAGTDPAEWKQDRGPALQSYTDAVIYELHIRDASIHSSSGMKSKGRYAALAESGTVNSSGLSTGTDHLQELGITHVHLLPFFDFASIDEARPNDVQYNWGYDPVNYNAPEGSYSSNAADPSVRIRELKTMIAGLHARGIGVVMDVVFNHVASATNSAFEQLAPGYYFRHDSTGRLSDATACGNETASEAPMMRKFMIESLEYWVKEYHIDGFRFDLMGVHDITTMNLIAKRLRRLRPGILLYGEGWTAGQSPLPEEQRAVKKNAAKLDGIAVFSDDLRDGIKGSVFDNKATGFVSGAAGLEQTIRFGVVASCPHPQVGYTRVNYSNAAWSANPSGTVTYVECHDNQVLWDRLISSKPGATDDELKKMYRLAMGIVFTSQGIAFMHAGSEFLRSKKGNDNSYNAGDSINAIDWNLKTVNADIYQYVRALIAMRRAHPAFRMTSGQEIVSNIRFMDSGTGVIAYTINGQAMKDSWKEIAVIYNSNDHAVSIQLPHGNWTSSGIESAGLPGKTADLTWTGSMDVPAFGMRVLYKQ